MNRFAKCCCAAASVAVCLTGAGPAWGISGLELVSATSTSSSTAFKAKGAYCPPDKRVVGGGGYAVEAPSTLNLTLTGLQPINRYGRTGYIARAAETGQRTSNTWSVSAYAICADAAGLGPWSIRSRTGPTSSASVKRAWVRCPRGRSVLGTGISMSSPTGHLVTQIARTSGHARLALAQAQEAPGGTNIRWSVTAHAICVVPPVGFSVPPFAYSTPLGELPNDSNSQVIASITCPGGRSLLGSGGGLALDAPPNVSLQGIFPTAGGKGAQAIAVENTPTAVKWGRALVSSSCAPS